MRAATHLAFAGLTGVIASGFGLAPDLAGAAALAAGSLLPDIDTPSSDIGRFIKPVSSLLERHVGHRTLTHSLLGLAGLALLSSPLLLVWPPVWSWLLIGMLTHILLDTCNIMGVPLFWPARLETVLMHNRAWRVPYGSPKEFTWLGCIALSAIALVPLSLDGFAPWFHRALGTPRGAIQDYLAWRHDHEVWLDVKGHNLLKGEDVDGRYRVIDVLNKDVLLVEDPAGQAYSVGRDSGVNILSDRVQAWRGEPLTSAHYRLELSGRLVNDLIHALPQGAQRVQLNATLSLKGDPELSQSVGTFERIRRSGQHYQLRAATPSDLAPLAQLVIESGSAVIRAEYHPNQQALASMVSLSSLPSVTAHPLRIPDLPSLAGLLVSIGDPIEHGELIARYVDDAALSLNAEELHAAREKIPELERTMSLERDAHQAHKAQLKASLDDAQDALERSRYLVSEGAAPRVRLSDAEATHRLAEHALLMEHTRWTGRLDALQGQLRQANLTIAKAERTQQLELDKQWVRSPVTGVIADIKLTGISTKGVNLEVVILERLEPSITVEHPSQPEYILDSSILAEAL